MKKIFILSVAATLICSVSYAKIWRVNNNNGVTADFTTAQAANNDAAVQNGDTIHLEPSLAHYGELDVTKTLTWISTGAFLDIYPNEQFSANVGRVAGLNISRPGCQNSVFQIYVTAAITIDQVGITINRCYVEGDIRIINTGNGNINNNNTVTTSFIRGELRINTGNNIVISNNIIGGAVGVGAQTILAVITNNVINARLDQAAAMNNSIVENNIFNKITAAYTFTNSAVQYNMSGAVGVLPAGNNNQNNITMSNVFVNNDGIIDSSFVLKAGSPAIGAGSSGVNLGAFGGVSPFKLKMQPPIPSIYKIQASSIATGNTLNVIFSTKSNN